HDHPRPALQPHGEAAVRLGRPHRGLAVSLTGRLERGQPLRPAPRGTGEHAVTAPPEREAAVDRLLTSDSHGLSPNGQEKGAGTGAEDTGDHPALPLF